MTTIRKFPCPACGTGMKIHTSHQLLTELRVQYAACGNPFCHASYVIEAKIVKIVSPPTELFEKNIAHFPICDSENFLPDCAFNFIKQHYLQAKNRDVLTADCVEYLRVVSPETSPEDIEMIAVQAVAGFDSRSCAGWIIATEDCNFATVVIYDDTGQRHAISLRELQHFITKRNHQEVNYEFF